MYKTIIGFAFLFLFCGIHPSSNAIAAETHQPTMTDSSLISVTGIVRFEQRLTRVAANLCGRSPCSHSKVYWSVVIDSGNDRYLLNRKFEMGRVEAPESVELMGVVLRPGSIVRVSGEVYSSISNPRFFILSQVKGLDLVMDLNDLEGSMFEPFFEGDSQR